MLKWTGERYLPGLEEATMGYEHLHRYAYGMQFVHSKKVLDLACGRGYGSYLLARTAESVLGIDIDVDAIRHASSNYLRKNLEFKVGSSTAVPLEGQNLFDVIVCDEALEHIDDHEKLLKEVKRLLVPDGLFMASTRNKWVYSDQPQYRNPSHVHEFDFQEFRALLDTYFRQVKFLGQRIYCNSSIWPLHSKDNLSLVEYVIERGPKEFLLVEDDKKIPMYFVALASDGGQAIDDKNSLLADVSNELLEQQARLVSEQQGLLQRVGELEATVQHQQEMLIRSEEQQRQLEAERGQLIQRAGELDASVQAQQQALVEKDQQIVHQGHLLAEKNQQVSKLLARQNSVQEGQSNLIANTVASSPGLDQYISELFAREIGLSSEYVSISNDHANLTEADVRLIAFYLPQFHPIPENDAWWGKGFTEWTHVARSTPQFLGHYQPHLPGELGFYDLRLIEVQRRQVELAQKYGIYGFCFYYYWFSGKRLLDLPLKQFLGNPDLDMPFCLCWANENWTRRWDGLDQRVLIGQVQSPENDLAFIQSIESMFYDKRYIRVNGRPLLIVYRPGLLPDPRSTAEKWREYCHKRGIGDLFLATVQAFGTTDPRPLGFDGAIEFPPHKLADGAPVLNSQLGIINPQYQGEVYDYAYMIQAARKVVAPEYTLFRGLCPSWDNEPRRPGRGHTFMNSSPDLYQEWLSYACAFATQNPDPDKRIVFINAWNEWGESNHLEPDRRFGYAYLQATADVLRRFCKGKRNGPEIVFVSHDANRAGAQKLLLILIRWLQDHTDIQPKVILRQGGVLTREFRRLAPVLEAETLLQRGRDALSAALLRFCRDSTSLIYINTLVPGDIAEILAQLRIPIITHVHELEQAIQRWCPKNQLEKILRLTDHFIAASPPVAENLSRRHGVASAQITTINEFIECSHATGSLADKKAIRKEKGLREKGLSLFGCGTTDWRKGPDLFIEVARRVISAGSRDVQFYWIGGSTEISERGKLDAKIRDLKLEDYVSFLGEVSEPRAYFLAGDLFLLTSREDPFPLVALEAADCGLPVVCFDGAGAMPGFVQGDAGYVVPFEDVQAMAEKVVFLGEHSEERLRMGSVAQQRVRERHDVTIAGQDIFRTIDKFAVKRSNEMSSPKGLISYGGHKLVNVIFALPDGLTLGGVTSLSVEICRELVKSGQPAALIEHSTIYGNPKLDFDLPQQVRVVSCTELPHPDNPWLDVAEYLPAYRSLLPGVFIPNWAYGTFAACAALAINEAENLRVIGYVHADEPGYYEYLSYYEAVIHRFVVSTRDIAAKLAGLIPHRQSDILVRPNPVNAPLVLQRRYSEAPTPLRLIYVARIAQRQKRVYDLVGLASALAAENVDFELRIIGDGVDKETLRIKFDGLPSTIRKRVSLEDCVSPRQLPEIWQAADISLLVSEFEGTSLAMLESMAYGCVPVVTQVGGTTIIEPGVNGYCVPVGSVTEMAQIIKNLANNRQMLARVGQEAHATIRTELSYLQYVNWFLQMVHAVWQDPPRCWPVNRALLLARPPQPSSNARGA